MKYSRACSILVIGFMLAAIIYLYIDPIKSVVAGIFAVLFAIYEVAEREK